VAVTATNHTTFILAGKGAEIGAASSLAERREIEAVLADN
jgi:hypothetical protein